VARITLRWFSSVRFNEIAFFLALAAPAAPTTIQVQIIEGQYAVQTAGTRSSTPFTVLIRDDSGKPVPGATVSLRLPDHDATGLFANGLRSEILLTGSDGRATVHGVQWGSTPGTCEIRVTAVKGTLRAGTIATVQITPPAAVPPAITSGLAGDELVPVYDPPSRWKSRWTVVVLAAAGAVGGGMVARYMQKSPPSATGVVGPLGVTGSTLQVGPPVVVVGRP
jgi:hypothetical protein